MTHPRLYNPTTQTVVPRKPTPDMLEAAYDRWPVGQEPGTESETKEDAAGVFAALIAAAPDASLPLPTLNKLATRVYSVVSERAAERHGLKNLALSESIAVAILALLAGDGK